MGYDIHITRADHWTDSESQPIGREEWISFLTADAEMRLDNFAEAETSGGEIIRYENEGLAVWTSYSGDGTAWFDYRHGEIIVKNPDEEILGKMRQIATAFGARVMGDEGELY